tara:strand:- start:1073 stop:1483 length:411 start_codon:yes stop_codon:yes gene_type:complete
MPDECWYENDIGRRLATAVEAPAAPPASKYLVEFNAKDATVTIRRPERARVGRAARAVARPSSAAIEAASVGAKVGGALNDYVCGGPVVQVEYLNLTAVKKALHVAADAFFFQCDNGVGFNYHGDVKALMPLYRHM